MYEGKHTYRRGEGSVHEQKATAIGYELKEPVRLKNRAVTLAVQILDYRGPHKPALLMLET
jgi:hypothetical protein